MIITRSIRNMMLVLAATLLSAACSRKEESPVNARVTLQATLADALQTRAITDGSAVDQVWCGAYLAGTLITEATAPVQAGAATLVLDLANNRTYDIVMWACKAGENAVWTVNPATAEVSAHYTKETASSAANDAFWYKGTLVPSGEKAVAIELTRAVAQILVGTSNTFTTATDVVVNVTSVPSSWNLLTGAMDGAADRSFSLGSAPAAETFGMGDATYNCLAAVSVLAPEAQTTVNISFSLQMDGTPVTKSVANTTIRRNWCTRIAGDIK